MIKLQFNEFADLLEEKHICIFLYDTTTKQVGNKNTIFDENLFDTLVELYGEHYVADIGSATDVVSCTLVPPHGWDEFTKEE